MQFRESNREYYQVSKLDRIILLYKKHNFPKACVCSACCTVRHNTTTNWDSLPPEITVSIPIEEYNKIVKYMERYLNKHASPK